MAQDVLYLTLRRKESKGKQVTQSSRTKSNLRLTRQSSRSNARIQLLDKSLLLC